MAGTDTPILRHPDRGSDTVAQEWTHWGVPDASSGPSETMRQLSFEALLQLADSLAELTEHLRSHAPGLPE